jgi:radical SAM protein with 4Fe4S-binding SPASM domain
MKYYLSKIRTQYHKATHSLEISKLGFDIVSGCQLRCIGCPNSIIKPKIKPISLSDFEACLSNIDADRIKVFRLFNFGEPLLHPDLPHLVNQIRNYNFKVGKIEISTNTQNCNFENLAETLKGKELDILVCSCDGDGTPAEYERLRPPAKWIKFVEFLTKAKELRDRYHPNLKLITRSICETEEGKARWRGVVEPLGWTPQFRGWLHLPGSERTKTVDLPHRNGLCTYMADVERYCYIDSDSNVVPCCVHPQAFLLGNLKEMKLSKILTSKVRFNYREQLQKNRSSLPICSKCDIFNN